MFPPADRVARACSQPRLWRVVTALSLLSALGGGTASARAQQSGVSAYYLNVGTRVGDGITGPAGSSDFQRFRVMGVKAWHDLLFDFGYEHTLVVRQTGASSAQLFTASGTASGGDWLDLGGEIESSDRAAWRHRVDRMSLQVDLGQRGDLVVGRQPISWATTLILTPGDPFSPFDPADPFREYRIGVDAARLRYYQGPFTQLELVVRPAKVSSLGPSPGGPFMTETMTVLARASTNWRGWDLGAWAGNLHDTFASSVFLSGALGTWALRFEGVVRDAGNRAVWRSTVGVDRIVPVAGRDLYVVFEYQRDGLGATRAGDLLPVAGSNSFSQGEVQTLGRDVAAARVSYQLHPLVSSDLLVLGNLRDGSMVFGPGVGYSITHSAALRLGAFLSTGTGATVTQGGVELGSEFGASPRVAFISLNLFL